MEESILIELNNEELIPVNNLSKICRICLLELNGTPFADVFFKEKRIADILSSHLIIKVNLDDFLPQNICSQCSEEILKMCSIIEKCQRADSFLQSYLRLTLNNDKLLLYDVVIKKEEVNTDIRNLEEREEVEVDCGNTSENDGDTVIVDGCSNIENTKCKMLEVNSNNSINQKDHIKRHMIVHTQERPFECQVCFKSFSFKGNLKRHMMIHTGERPHICDICGKAFSQFVVLTGHKKTHVSHEQVNPETGVPTFTCSHCGRIFKRSTHYNTHIKKHEKNQNKARNEEDKEPEEQIEKKHQCNVCMKSYKTKASLYTHRIQHREKSFLCNACGKCFQTRATLKIHLTVHTGEKPHKCKFCPKSFSRIVNLEYHLLIHTGVKPHLCKTCGKTFTQSAHLRYHILTHTGERAYECSYCGKRFASKGSLTVHVRTHTGETPYVCSVCNKGFYDSSSMKKHKKGHEKLTSM